MTIPCSLNPLGSGMRPEDGYLVIQKFGALSPNPTIMTLKKGYYWVLLSGAGGQRKSNAWGNNASGGLVVL